MSWINLRKIINPAFFFLESTKSTQKLVMVINLIIGLSHLFYMLFKIINLQKKYGDNDFDLKNNKFVKFSIFFGYYFISNIFITFYSGIFSCEMLESKSEKVEYFNKENECEEFNSTHLFSIFLIGFIINRIYYGIMANYSRRILMNKLNLK